MKTLIQIQTDPFALISQEMECATPEEAVEAYTALSKAYNGGFGLETKEWNEALDKYLKGKGMTSDVYDAMNKEQQWMIQEIKKSNKRK